MSAKDTLARQLPCPVEYSGYNSSVYIAGHWLCIWQAGDLARGISKAGVCSDVACRKEMCLHNWVLEFCWPHGLLAMASHAKLRL